MASILGQVSAGIPNVSIPWQWVTGGFFLLLFGMVGYFLFAQYTYPILVIIRRKIGMGEMMVFDHGKPIMRDGLKMMWVHGVKQYNSWPKTEYLYPYKGLNPFKKYVIELYQDANGLLGEGMIEIKTSAEKHEVNFVPDDKSKQAWAQQQRKRNREENAGDFWARYGVLVGESILVLGLIVMGMVIGNKHVEASKIIAKSVEIAGTICQTHLGG